MVCLASAIRSPEGDAQHQDHQGEHGGKSAAKANAYFEIVDFHSIRSGSNWYPDNLVKPGRASCRERKCTVTSVNADTLIGHQKSGNNDNCCFCETI
jgi:hypothetical protein